MAFFLLSNYILITFIFLYIHYYKLAEDCRDAGCLIVALSKIMVDPFYRTEAGFEVLIEQEWIAAGHPFASRCGHVAKSSKHTRTFNENSDPTPVSPSSSSTSSSSSTTTSNTSTASSSASASSYTDSDDDHSPFFLLFLDCVFQLMSQYPLSFEITDRYLITLCDSLWSCLFGSFVADSEKDRIRSLVEIKTLSVWAHMRLLVEKDFDCIYKNPAYIGYQPIGAPSSERSSSQIAETPGGVGILPQIPSSSAHDEKTLPSHASTSLTTNSEPDSLIAAILNNYNINQSNGSSSITATTTKSKGKTSQKALLSNIGSYSTIHGPEILFPKLDIVLIEFWNSNYLRWVPHIQPTSIHPKMTTPLFRTKQLLEEIAKLESEKERLEKGVV